MKYLFSMADTNLHYFRNLLAAYFDSDELRRFRFEKHIGNGIQGHAWRLIYGLLPPLIPRRIVLKHDVEATRYNADYVETDEILPQAGPIANEKHWLTVRNYSSFSSSSNAYMCNWSIDPS